MHYIDIITFPERLIPVPDYEERYLISESGVLITKRAGRLLKQTPNPDGYPMVCFNTSGLRKHIRVHKLIATVFFGPCPDGLETVHLDNNPGNNHIWNLEYQTHIENCLQRSRGMSVNRNHLQEPERWLPVPPPHHRFYECSSHGRVKSLDRYSVVAPFERHKGYYDYGLSDKNRKTIKSIQRLVCWAFNGPPPHSSYEAHHIDFNRMNNHYSNLEWRKPGTHTRLQIERATKQ